MYGEKSAEPAFNAIAFYLHVAGGFLLAMCTNNRYVGARRSIGLEVYLGNRGHER